MKRMDLIRAVARATGESVDRVQRMGFNLLRGPASRDHRQAPDREVVRPGTHDFTPRDSTASGTMRAVLHS